MINKLKYYISKGTEPYTNLAIEKYLFDNVDDNCYILYLWQNKNTVVIGQNQNPWTECKCSLLESEGGRLVRRLSGGGAVYHDLGNLNFTFISTTDNMDTALNTEVIISACNMTGIKRELTGRNDITADGKKFSGNAFYNSGGKSYHHGTLLISSDKEKLQRYLTPPKSKLESKGVKSVKSRIVNLSELSENLSVEDMRGLMIESFKKTFGLSAEEIPDVGSEKICNDAEKFKSWEYIYGNTFPFTASFEHSFPWGHINLQLKANNGIITDTRTYTDALDTTLPEKINTALTGCRFTKKDMLSAISRMGIYPELIDLIDI